MKEQTGKIKFQINYTKHSPDKSKMGVLHQCTKRLLNAHFFSTRLAVTTASLSFPSMSLHNHISHKAPQ